MSRWEPRVHGSSAEGPSILIAEDDQDDRFLLKVAMKSAGLANPLHFVDDGVELFSFLGGCGCASEGKRDPPGLILLDMNMPQMSGREVLVRIRYASPIRIPIVVLTTSVDAPELALATKLGACAAFTKPTSIAEFGLLLQEVVSRWMSKVGGSHI